MCIKNFFDKPSWILSAKKQKRQAPNSIEKNPTEKPTEKQTEIKF